jgi:hypothetical protein
MTRFESARPVPVHDPREQQNGYAGRAYVLPVGWDCYRDAAAALGPRNIEVVDAPCAEWCEWCGGA